MNNKYPPFTCNEQIRESFKKTKQLDTLYSQNESLPHTNYVSSAPMTKSATFRKTESHAKRKPWQQGKAINASAD